MAVDAALDARMARLSVVATAGAGSPQGQGQPVLVDTSSLADAVFQVRAVRRGAACAALTAGRTSLDA